MQSAVVVEERNDGSEQHDNQRNYRGCTCICCTNRAILTPLTMLLGISQSALHVGYYRS